MRWSRIRKLGPALAVNQTLFGKGNTMITKKLIQGGIQAGYIHFVIDPYMESGTVCQIGDNWFYFGGLTAEEMNPQEYIENVPIEDIANEVFDVLEEFKTVLPDEYLYYELYLSGLPERREKGAHGNTYI